MVPGFSKAWYDDKSISNIFSLNNLFHKYRVTYDSQQDYAFIVQTNIGIIKFRRKKQGLYIFNSTYATSNLNIFATAKENVVGFTSRQIESSKLGRKIYRNVGTPTVENFKHMVSTNMI